MALTNDRSSRVRVYGLDLEGVRALVRSAPDGVANNIAPELEKIGQQGVQDIQDRIINSPTKTGIKAVAKGLRSDPGRIRGAEELKNTNRPRIGGKSMYDSVDSKVQINKRSVSLRFGWLDGKPGYSFFQEHGTSNGVPAMHALTDAKAKAEGEIQQVIRNVKWR
jgi:hypothetical protein